MAGLAKLFVHLQFSQFLKIFIYLILRHFIYLIHNIYNILNYIFNYILFIINTLYIYYIVDLQMTQTNTHTSY